MRVSYGPQRRILASTSECCTRCFLRAVSDLCIRTRTLTSPQVLDSSPGEAEFLVQQLADARQQLEALKQNEYTESVPMTCTNQEPSSPAHGEGELELVERERDSLRDQLAQVTGLPLSFLRCFRIDFLSPEVPFQADRFLEIHYTPCPKLLRENCP